MLIKRLIAAIVITALLAACAPAPTKRDDGAGTQTSQPASGTNSGTDSGSDGNGTQSKSSSSGSGGSYCGGLNFNGINGRAGLAIVVIIVVVVAAVGIAYLASETIDYIKKHTQPAPDDTILDGVYHAPDDLCSVAIPEAQPMDAEVCYQVRVTESQGQVEAFFFPKADGKPVYIVSVKPKLSAKYVTMSLDDFASDIYSPPESSDSAPISDKSKQPLLDEKILLDGKPALFRTYIQTPEVGSKQPVYYMLYFIKSGDRGVLLSIT